MAEKRGGKHFPDRPLECSECKKPIAIRYTEIIGNNMTHTSMCSDCPELQKRLHGTSPAELVYNQAGASTGVCCGNCGTTLEEVKRGHRLGCTECYDVFGDVLLMEIVSANKLSPKTVTNKKTLPVHIGRSPGEALTVTPSSRLLALNEALKETLSREDYEQAAWLRDQIREITENERKTERKPNEHKES